MITLSRKKKSGLGGIAVAAMVTTSLLAASPAAANTEQVGGGTWNWGNTFGWNYSDFITGQDHASTVQCGDSEDRDLAGPDQWSNAGLWAVSGCGFFWSLL